VALGVMALALGVYVRTLAPGLTFEHYGTDGGDLIAAARTLGVPHPSGYPTYTVMAWLFSHLPLGNIAYRVNLLSAFCAAAAVGVSCRTAQLLLPNEGPSLLVSAMAALVLAFSSLLWSQAVISEVYALLILFAALLLWLLVRWRMGCGDGCLWLAAFLLGLGLGSHLTLALLVPAGLVLAWRRGARADRRWMRPRTFLPAMGLFAVGLGIYAYLPLAATHRPPVNWGNPQTWGRFLWLVTGEPYRALVFGLSPGEIPARLATWANLLGDQFGWWGLVIALAGAGWAWRRDRHLVVFSLVWMLLVWTYAFFYDTIDSHVYLLPTLLLFALWWAEGAYSLIELTRRSKLAWWWIVLVALVALPFASLALHWRATDLSHDWRAHAFMHQVLEGVEPNGLVIVQGDGPTFALWYGVYAEERRPDVAVVSRPLLAYAWYRDNLRVLYPDLILNEATNTDVTTDDLVRDLIESNAARRPAYAIDPGESWNEWLDVQRVRDAPLYRIRPKNASGSGE
jgi:hypothetical protein